MQIAKSLSLSLSLSLAAAVAVAVGGQPARAQGCVAAHTNQRTLSELVRSEDSFVSPFSLHNLSVDIGYRVFSSNKYFQGSDEIARPTAVRNHQNIFDIGVQYRLSPRWSLVADVPVFDGTRNQIYPPSGIFQVSGLGDTLVGAQAWILRPPAENGGNIAVSAQLKIPTGINNAQGSALLGGKVIKATADQSLQPGDGGWGFNLGTQGYKRLWHTASAYGQGSYLFNPENTNNVPTFRSQPGQGVMSVTDSYLFRAGLTQAIPAIPGMRKLPAVALSLGIRGEGVPVRDLLGDSNGFRRPGSILSLDPGLLVNFKHDTLSVNGPWALHRNRPPSVPEQQYNITNGDAFFADYTVVASLSHRF